MVACLSEMLGPDFQVESAGTYEGLATLPIGCGIEPSSEIAKYVKKHRLDISANRSPHVSKRDLTSYELIICVDTLVEYEVRHYLNGAPVRTVVPDKKLHGIIDPPRTTSDIDEPIRRRCVEQIQRTMREIADQLLRGP